MWYKGFVAAIAAFLVVLLSMGSCANIGQPEGGPLDVRPPRLKRAVPPNGAVNVAQSKFRLYFDENVKIERQQEKVTISPPQRGAPKLDATNHVVTITLADELHPNTTYVIDFSDAIVDGNEGNALENFVYAFSTGARIDSSQIEGLVIDARTLEVVEGVTVGAYRGTIDTLTFRKRAFDNATKTRPDGRFIMKYLADTSFAVFALGDMDHSYTLSQSTEALGFLDHLVQSEPMEQGRPISRGKEGAPDSIAHGVDSLLTPFLDSVYIESADSLAAQELGDESLSVISAVDSLSEAVFDTEPVGANADSLSLMSTSDSLGDSSAKPKPFKGVLIKYFTPENIEQSIKRSVRQDSTALLVSFALPIDSVPRLERLGDSTVYLATPSLVAPIVLVDTIYRADTLTQAQQRETSAPSDSTMSQNNIATSAVDSLPLEIVEDTIIGHTELQQKGAVIREKQKKRYDQTAWYLGALVSPTEAVYFLTDSTMISRGDSLHLSLNYASADSLGQPIIVTDTLKFPALKRAIPTPEGSSKKTKAKSGKAGIAKDTEPAAIRAPRYSIKLRGGTGLAAKSPQDSIVIELSAPPLEPIAPHLRLEHTADSIWAPLEDYHLEQNAANPLNYQILAPWEYGKNYRLTIDSATVRSIYGAENDSIAFNLSISKEEEFGMLELTLKDALPRSVVELINDRDIVLHTMALPDSGKLTFIDLKPGTYYARLFVDANANGRWDTGYYKDESIKTPPEEVHYCPLSLTVNTKFTTVETWQVGAVPIWEQRPKPLRKVIEENKERERRKDLNEEYERRMEERRQNQPRWLRGKPKKKS